MGMYVAGALLAGVTVAMLSGCAMMPVVPVEAAPVLVGGTALDCDTLPSNLDLQINAQNVAYFSDWSDGDYDQVRQLVTTCSPNYGPKVTAQRIAALAQLQKSHDARMARVVAENERWEECTQTRAYQRYEAANSVINGLKAERYWNRVLRQEQRAGRISGAVDLETEHTAGLEIVQEEDEVSQAWRTYRRDGGEAPTLGALFSGTAGLDPCAGPLQ